MANALMLEQLLGTGAFASASSKSCENPKFRIIFGDDSKFYIVFSYFVEQIVIVLQLLIGLLLFCV